MSNKSINIRPVHLVCNGNWIGTKILGASWIAIHSSLHSTAPETNRSVQHFLPSSLLVLHLGFKSINVIQISLQCVLVSLQYKWRRHAGYQPIILHLPWVFVFPWLKWSTSTIPCLNIFEGCEISKICFYHNTGKQIQSILVHNYQRVK